MRWILAGLLALGAPTMAAAQVVSIDDVRDIEADAIRDAHSMVPDLPGTGPYPAIKEELPGLSNHVVYRPDDLAALDGRRLGVLLWGNGGCRNDGASARMHLTEIASHGYLVIAPGRIYSGPGAHPAESGRTTTEDVLAGLDWALAENQRPDSALFGLIDPAAVAVSGHSCGGLQALLAAPDPRIATTIIHNSGVFADTDHPVDGLVIGKSHLANLRTPTLYVLGGPGDVAYPNGTDDFGRIDQVPVMLVDINVGHGGTFRTLYGGRAAQIAVDWLEWQLRGDAAAARSFVGPACRLCLEPDLRVQKKGIDGE